MSFRKLKRRYQYHMLGFVVMIVGIGILAWTGVERHPRIFPLAVGAVIFLVSLGVHKFPGHGRRR
ncbi:MAG: hypothetical protein QGH20_01200 [Candidatus Latescibacteria bacterium]|jgi:hypothetical protein|nr:hypothetical protein [Candidatus Latescibacterota bacterium]